jgi:GntR family transcriptional regulator/MocR family aminotransferase
LKRRAAGPLFSLFAADAEALPIYQRICRAVREAVAAGALGSGDKLPSARALSGDLRVSRSTVEAAYAELDAEGLVVRKVGAGSYIARAGAAREARPKGHGASPRTKEAWEASFSSRGRALHAVAARTAPTLARAFTPCLPGLDLFPFATWNRVLQRRLRSSAAALAASFEPAGHEPLRRAIATHLAASRGVRCDASQVVITTGTQQALALCAQALADPGDQVWLEEPGYLGARAAFELAGAEIVPVPVDGEGLQISAGKKLCPRPAIIYATPSCQFPLGATLSARRRQELGRFASAAGVYILEDDYDSEFRYGGQPLAALQGTAARVLHLGTFNKILFPALRLGFLIVPPGLVEPLVQLRTLWDGPVPALQQAALADFLSEGHFGEHVRRMRTHYEERRATLLDAAARELPESVEVRGSDAGMHVVVFLPDGEDDAALSAACSASGLDVPPLSRYYLGPSRRSGLVLSYAAATPAEIRSGMRVLGRCF